MKLHIGAGAKFLPGYKHMDAIPHSHIDYVGDASDLSFLSNGSLDEIYACHILEHFKREKVQFVLNEWFKKLRVGGILRLAVPNFEAIANVYAHNGNLDEVMGLLYGGQDNEYNFHYQTYDFTRLKRLLNGAGFYKIEKYNWKEFLPNGFDDFSRAYLPHMDFENGELMSLNIIAEKE